MIQIKSFTFNILGTNCYVLWEDGGKRCVIVDPGMYRDFEEQEMLGFLDENALTPDGILLNLYYTRVPLADIEKTMQALLRAWQIA